MHGRTVYQEREPKSGASFACVCAMCLVWYCRVSSSLARITVRRLLSESHNHKFPLRERFIQYSRSPRPEWPKVNYAVKYVGGNTAGR